MEAMLGQLLAQQKTTPTIKTKSIDDIGNERNSKIIIIRHDYKKGYVPLLDHNQQLSREDALNFVKTLKSVPKDKTLEIILHTPGGCLGAAEIIINALLNHTGKIIVYVPYYACSSGTLLALAADEIYLDYNAYMGPVDPQFAFGYSAQNVINFVKKINNDVSWVTDLVKLISEEAQLSISWVEELINKIYKVKNRPLTSNLLFSGTMCHQRPLFYNDLSTIIPFIKEGVPEELCQLVDLAK